MANKTKKNSKVAANEKAYSMADLRKLVNEMYSTRREPEDLMAGRSFIPKMSQRNKEVLSEAVKNFLEGRAERKGDREEARFERRVSRMSKGEGMTPIKMGDDNGMIDRESEEREIEREYGGKEYAYGGKLKNYGAEGMEVEGEGDEEKPVATTDNRKALRALQKEYDVLMVKKREGKDPFTTADKRNLKMLLHNIDRYQKMVEEESSSDKPIIKVSFGKGGVAVKKKNN